jgi:ubiquinone/menaquinone biosynthesis C-methylase UbiE
MIRSFLKNCRKPQGIIGRFVAKSMNTGHAVISEWGLSYLRPAKDAHVLDIGCGGGANIVRLLKMCPDGRVCGIDYSEESVRVSRKINAAALGLNCEIRQGSVSALPYGDGSFDAIVAFETVYFWPDLASDFHEVRRVLKPGGTFMICVEAHDPADTTWPSRIDGMRIYSKDELFVLLSGAGFEQAEAYNHSRGWLCVTAKAGKGANR